MAKQERTVLDRVEHVARSLNRISRTVRNELDQMAELEEYLPKNEAVIALFRLHIRAIRSEMDSLSVAKEET